jgi:aquaporin Z
VRAYLAELIGSTLWATVALATLLTDSDLRPVAVGAAVLALVVATARISGGHANPATSVAAVIRGALPLAELVPYLAAQLLGGLLAYLLLVTAYGDQLDAWPGPIDLGGLVVAAFALELAFTFALVWVHLVTVGRYARGEHGLTGVDHEVTPAGLAVGGVALAGTAVAAPVSGAAFNPAVTFAMTLAGVLAWKWLPVFVLAQLLGAGLAALLELFTTRSEAERAPTPKS